MTFWFSSGQSTGIDTRELADCGVKMAQKVNVSFVDDLDGSEAEGTVVFGVDGKQYEIDLSESNAAKLRELFTPFVDAARKVGGGARVPRMSSVARASRDDAKIIREWAATQGFSVSARGESRRRWSRPTRLVTRSRLPRLSPRPRQ